MAGWTPLLRCMSCLISEAERAPVFRCGSGWPVCRDRASESHVVHPPRTKAGSGTACRSSQLPLNPAGWKQWSLSLLTQEDTASKIQLLWEPHSGVTDLGFSHSGIHFIRERGTNTENGLIFIQEKAKEEDREKLGEKEETIPPDYRLEEAKVNRPGSFF